MKNIVSEVIDELNNRMEKALDNDDVEVNSTLESFYEWFVDKYIY